MGSGRPSKCHVKFPTFQKQSFAIMSVIPDKGVVHNNNSYISEDIVLKHTSAKFDLVICKHEVNRKQASLNVYSYGKFYMTLLIFDCDALHILE